MNKIKVLLSAILFMAILAGTLAFKLKSPDVCAYTRVIAINPPATTLCQLFGVGTVITTLGLSTQYATIFATLAGSNPCPFASVTCSRFKTLQVEE